MKQNIPSVKIKKIDFNNGTELKLNADDIVIFVGANNVGKSRILKDIKEDLLDQTEKKIIIKKIEYCKENFDIETIKDFFENNFSKDSYLNYNIQIDQNTFSYSQYDFCDSISEFQKFYKAFFTFLSTGTRLDITSPISHNEYNSNFRLKIIENLEFSENKIKKLNGFLSAGFGKAIDVYQGSFENNYIKTYKIGTEEEINEIIRLPKRNANEKLKKLEFLHEQGDGIRSSVAILATLIANEHSILLIDEPEAFLHPPQARLLGNNIVELSENKQCFLATHNIDIIRGILEKNSSRVKIVKINRENNNNTILKLDNPSVIEIATDRNLKYTNILNGLFYSKVVLCESESDCKFYSAILEHLDEKIAQNTIFCAVGGKDQFKVILPLLKRVSIDYIIIADIDLINDREKLKQLMNSIEQNKYNEIESTHNSFLNEYESRTDSSVKTQAVIKERIDKLFTSDIYMSDETAKSIKNELKEINSLKLLKTGGKAIIPQGNCISLYIEIKTFLKQNQIYLLDCGEIERFIPDIDLHGNAWVEQVFNQYKNLDNPVYDDVKKFIKDVFDI